MAAPRQTGLYDQHRARGARIVTFAGWRMPLQYTSISEEHNAVRQALGVFDVSHMGEFLIRGSRSIEFLQTVTSNDVSRIAEGQCQYTLLLSDEGTIIDDLVLYCMAGDRYMMVVNAATRDTDREWLLAHNSFGVDIEDVTDQTTLLAIQGPQAESVIRRLTSCNLSQIARFAFVETVVAGTSGILSRTGYTGEDGFEFCFPRSDSVEVWESLLQAGQPLGALPSGLGARNTLRLEAAMLLYGIDMDRTTTPLEAGLGWTVKFDKGGFIGSDALQRQKDSGIRRRLAGFRMLGREIAREGYPVIVDRQQVGRVTSGAPSITLGRNIGLAYLPVEHALPGSHLTIQVRSRLGEAEIVDTPFYKRRRSV